MRRTLLVTGIAASLIAGPVRGQENPTAPELVASTEPRSPGEERAGFHLPPGFEIQLVAAEPDIHKPLNLAFDERGRLWVTETVEYPYPAAEGATPRDAVKVLADFGPDGRARSITTFAEGLNIPIGVLPLPGGALVHSIPNVYRMFDDDGDGRADRREVAYAEYGSADTHGMTNAFTWGFDGWVYACHGFSNTSTVRGADGAAITMHSGNVYRMRPDGSHLEFVTHGQVNPFGLAFDPRGNLYSCDCHTRPIYQLLPGAYYPSFGKPHDGLGFGPEMVTHDHGSTAIAGLVYYAADHFPAAYRDTVFIGNVVTNRINHDRLRWHGASPEGIAGPDFLSSDDPWFRPVDLKLGPDGALYVADFYNRIIGHYEVPLTHPGRDRHRGRIWRIVYRGEDGRGRPEAPRPDWTTATVEALIADLAHPNLAVRMTATNVLARREGEGIDEAIRSVVQDASNPRARCHALWVLERRGVLDDATLAGAARDGDAAVRVHARRILADRAELPATLRAAALDGLEDDDPLVRRTSAEALGRHPSAGNLRPLLVLRLDVPREDTHLLHVARMALREQLRPESAWEVVNAESWTEAEARALADAAAGVPSAEAASFLLGHVRRLREPRDQFVRLAHHVARHGDSPASAGIVAFARSDRPEDLALQAALLRAIQQGFEERKDAPDDAASALRGWALALVPRLIDSGEEAPTRAGIDLARALKLAEVRDRVEAQAVAAGSPEPLRMAAIDALAAIDPEMAVEPLGRILADGAAPAPVREGAANALARLNRPEAQEVLLDVLPKAPARLQTTLAAGLAGNRSGANLLLDAVAAGRASPQLLRNRAVELRLAATGLPDLEDRLDDLLRGLPPADDAIQALIEGRRKGFASATPDADRGARVFETACAACHQIGGKGARVGPQLDGVGLRGTDRLLEDILDPSRNVDQAFRTTTLALENGQVISGLLLSEEGEVLILADAQGKEVRVSRDAVEERALAPLSPMPANLKDGLSEGELYDLLAYLLRQVPHGDEPASR